MFSALWSIVLSLALALATLQQTQAAQTLVPLQFKSLPIGQIQPQGWLKTQLEVQAAGLTGHLAHFWPGVQNSSWIQPNGHGDNGLEEFATYWLNGMVPLHFLLPDNRELQAQSWQYISYILAQQSADGWLGVDNISGGNMYWGRWNCLNALHMYCEGNQTMCAPVKQALLKYMLAQEHRMMTVAAYGDTWSGARWMDFSLSVYWLLENGGAAIAGYEQNLTHVAQLSHAQGFDWEYWFEHLPTQPVTQMTLYTHGVNNAQAFKSAAVWYRMSANASMRALSAQRLANMDRYHGQATGMFAADEHLAGRMPSRGTETCDVVEYMWSFQVMFRVFGDVRDLDRMERVAMNALPATFGSPAGGEMWAHQYLQQNNEVNSMYTSPHVWASDGPNSTLYGLQPNYGCCTANFNQGFPKYAAAIFFTTDTADEIAIGIYAPAVAVVYGHRLNISTRYPFEDDIRVYIDMAQGGGAAASLRLLLRIPVWANDATVTLDGVKAPNTPGNGTMFAVEMNNAGTGKHVVYLNFNPRVRYYKGYQGSVSLLYQSLLFSLPIGEEWRTINSYAFESKDYWCLPTTDWNYALMIDDLNRINASVAVERSEWVVGHAPFNRTDIPIKLRVNVSQVHQWGLETGAAAPPPQSPACAQSGSCSFVGEVLLVPHGTTDLRIAELPLANTHY